MKTSLHAPNDATRRFFDLPESGDRVPVEDFLRDHEARSAERRDVVRGRRGRTGRFVGGVILAAALVTNPGVRDGTTQAVSAIAEIPGVIADGLHAFDDNLNNDDPYRDVPEGYGGPVGHDGTGSHGEPTGPN